jgi:protein-S-isoprenylcysteine O-methyltransferase Ste14
VPRIALKYQYFAANLALLSLGLVFYRTNHYYLNFLSDEAQAILLGAGIAYAIGGFFYYRLAAEPRATHGYIAIGFMRRWLSGARAWLNRFPDSGPWSEPAISTSERNSLLFLLLKFFYLPMMIQFVLGNWHALAVLWWSYSGVMLMPRLEAFNNFVVPCVLDVFFIIECAFYAFGYAVESPRCRNVIKSIDPTVFGWAVTLACYPPFNGFVNNYASWYTSDDPPFTNPALACAAKSIVLLCFAIYVWGAFSLGAKCSNLSNRGIVTTGAFAYVRHPAYAAKNLAWWIALLPVLSVPAALSMTFWSFMYFLRAITEERHLSQDPDYREYCRKVPYRFVPGLW